MTKTAKSQAQKFREAAQAVETANDEQAFNKLIKGLAGARINLVKKTTPQARKDKKKAAG